MCGFFAHYGELDEKTFLECFNKIKHRGPDFSDVYKEEKIKLGHHRLSILDLDDRANQPMTCLLYTSDAADE